MSPPVVWTRSVGLEVINELDTIKAALMVAAGSGVDGPRFGGNASGWEFAAKSLENLSRAADTAKVVQSGLVKAVEGGLHQLGNLVSQTSRR